MEVEAPVQLVNYRIKRLNFEVVKDFEQIKVKDTSFSTHVDFNLYGTKENPLKYTVEIILKISPLTDQEVYLPYEIALILQGIFLFEEGMEDEEIGYHLNISCTSMLYGVARNIIHQLTGQSSYGAIIIPAVQFSKIAGENQKVSKDSKVNKGEDNV
jgi:preprotein translocase subunit SecB